MLLHKSCVGTLKARFPLFFGRPMRNSPRDYATANSRNGEEVSRTSNLKASAFLLVQNLNDCKSFQNFLWFHDTNQDLQKLIRILGI